MSENVKNRGWVKNAAIVFLVILLILTFFSNTIMNRSLPKVATQYIQSGTITAKVRGTGKVEAVGLYEVKAEQTREIRAVMVKSGEEVEAGDVLFVLGDGTSEEIKQTQEKLRQLQTNLKKAGITGPVANYSLEEYMLQRAQTAYEEAVAEENRAFEELSNLNNNETYRNNLMNAEAKLNAAQMNQAMCEADYNSRIETALNRVLYAQDALYSLQSQEPAEKEGPVYEEYLRLLAEAEAAVNRENEAYYALLNNPDPALEAAKKATRDAQEEYDRIINYIMGPAAEKYNAAVAARLSAEETLISRQASLNTQMMTSGQAYAIAAVEIEDLKQQIEIVQQELDILTGGAENQIKAKVSGTVGQINYTAGSTVPKDSALCTIEVPDMGYKMSFSCTNDQAKRLHVGDTATVSNYYWGTQIEATLVSIQTDVKNPQNSKLLTFELKGNVTSGSELTISVGTKSASYDVIVPNNAIRTDSNGSYVFVVESKNSALMNRYYARRVAVQTIATDDLNSAVTGDLKAGSYVITTSNIPIKNGDQVRFEEGA